MLYEKSQKYPIEMEIRIENHVSHFFFDNLQIFFADNLNIRIQN